MIPCLFLLCSSVSFAFLLIGISRELMEYLKSERFSQTDALKCIFLSLSTFCGCSSIPQNGSDPINEVLATFFANRLAFSLTLIPVCSATQNTVTLHSFTQTISSFKKFAD